MKTQVIMCRDLFGQQIRQESKSGMFNATDLAAAGNTWRADNGMGEFKLDQWLTNKSTQEFISEIEKSENTPAIMAKRGRNGGTWMHPLLFIDMALAISPKLKLEAYKWLYDELLKYRNDSGDSYRLMCDALHVKIEDDSKFKKCIIRVAIKIKNACGVFDWQKATAEQLKNRDELHNNIRLLVTAAVPWEVALEHSINQIK